MPEPVSNDSASNNKEKKLEKAVRLDKIETAFGAKKVHRGVSFDIDCGTVTAIIGGSGSGKSVLLREMLGLSRPTAGTIELLGSNLLTITGDELSDLRARIGVLFQSGALFSGLTVNENIAAPIRERLQLEREILDSVVEGRLLLAGLPRDAGAKMPSELSGGMVKRAALARALALEPEILFLDEPTSGLDPVMARSFDELIRTLCDNLGITVCMITHDIESLRNITDTIVVLGEGIVTVKGSYDEVSRFDNEWIREYFR